MESITINPIGSPEWLAAMRIFEDQLNKYEKEFNEKFIHSSGFWMFEEVALNSDSVRVTWLEWQGEHITITVKLTEVLNWLKEIKN